MGVLMTSGYVGRRLWVIYLWLSTLPYNLTHSPTLSLAIHHRRNGPTTYDSDELENVGGWSTRLASWWIIPLSPSANCGA